jgi:23S rRNA pseudoU1915 N3-methylase RlmH
MKVHIMFISDSDKHFSGAIQEYEKRLGNICILHQIKPVKYGTQSEIIAKETKKIEKELQKNTYKDSRIVLLEK